MTNTQHTPDDGRYYAENGRVWKAPTKREKPDGSSNYSLGFPVCDLTEMCAGQEAALAELLNLGTEAPAMLDALRAIVREADRETPAFIEARAILAKFGGAE